MTALRWDAPSRLLSVDDDSARPTQRLVTLCSELAATIPNVMHHILDERQTDLKRWFDIWPGEHYNLLTAVAELLHPRVVWEFGTYTAMGTVALLEGLLPGAAIFTVDKESLPTLNWLSAGDLDVVNLIKGDMTDEALFSHPRLCDAELIFIDGPKDGVTEPRFLELLSGVEFTRDPIVIFDDIREMNMVYLWRNLRRPKMDMTSFGHFTGTGIVDWNGKLGS